MAARTRPDEPGAEDEAPTRGEGAELLAGCCDVHPARSATATAGAARRHVCDIRNLFGETRCSPASPKSDRDTGSRRPRPGTSRRPREVAPSTPPRHAELAP